MKKFITATAETRAFIQKAYGVSKMTVWRALHFQGKGTPMEQRIRKLALERGGMVMNVSPEMETIHNEADSCMRQYFPNGVMIEAWRDGSDRIDVIKDGEVVRSATATVPTLYELQAYAENL